MSKESGQEATQNLGNLKKSFEKLVKDTDDLNNPYLTVSVYNSTRYMLVHKWAPAILVAVGMILGFIFGLSFQ